MNAISISKILKQLMSINYCLKRIRKNIFIVGSSTQIDRFVNNDEIYVILCYRPLPEGQGFLPFRSETEVINQFISFSITHRNTEKNINKETKHCTPTIMAAGIT